MDSGMNGRLARRGCWVYTHPDLVVLNGVLAQTQPFIQRTRASVVMLDTKLESEPGSMRLVDQIPDDFSADALSLERRQHLDAGDLHQVAGPHHPKSADPNTADLEHVERKARLFAAQL